MNYQNPFINPYGFGQQMPGQYMQPGIQQPKQAEKVNGRNGAMQYPMGPNSQAWILDESGLMSWLILTDSAGYKTVTPYDIMPHEEKQAQDIGNLESRIKRLEEIVNGNSCNTSAAGEKQHGTAGAARAANDEPGEFRAESAGGIKPAYYEQSANENSHGYRPEARRRSDGSLQG